MQYAMYNILHITLYVVYYINVDILYYIQHYIFIEMFEKEDVEHTGDKLEQVQPR